VEAGTVQPLLYPLHWDEDSEVLISPTGPQLGVSNPAAGPGHDNSPPPPEVGRNHAAPPMLTATQYDATHPVPPSMHIRPVPLMILTLKLQAAPTDQLL